MGENAKPVSPATDAPEVHYPNMATAQLCHISRLSAASLTCNPLTTVQAVQAALIKDGMVSTYQSLSTLLNWDPSSTSSAISSMTKSNELALESLTSKQAAASSSQGEMEIIDSAFAFAAYYAKIGDKEQALTAYDKILKIPKLSTGKKIDALMGKSRVANFHNEDSVNYDIVDEACKKTEDGGDWDKRNRLKIYSALVMIVKRDLKSAASLLIDCTQTFACSELCSYKEFVVYASICNILHLARPELKSQIIDCPEILATFSEIGEVSDLVVSFYDCDYRGYMEAIANVEQTLLCDRYLSRHTNYIIRELIVLGYRQFLDSYKSVTLESMASTFGVGAEFLDLQLSRFIAAGRLTAKIDKVSGTVMTNRPDTKNAQYKEMIQKGDLLLNQIQKLARIADV